MSLPGLSGAPEWEDFNGDGFWRPQLHDPRWSGAPHDLLTYLPVGGSTSWTDEVAVRIVAQGKFVYISFLVQSDDTGPDADDYVYVGLSKGALNNATLLKIDGRTGTPIAAPPAPPPPATLQADTPLPQSLAAAAVTRYETTDATTGTGGWGPGSAGLPTWARGARWDRTGGVESPKWAITLRLDLSPTGYNIGGDTRMFLGAKINKSTGDVIVGNRTPILVDADNVDDTIVPNLSTSWQLFGEPGTACTTGVSLASSDVGVWTGPAGSSAGGSLTHEICAGGACGSGENVFRAIARNVPSAQVSTWGLRARFRIADWGAQPAHWNSGRWRDISVTPTGTEVLSNNTSPSPFTAANGWYWQDASAGGGMSNVTIDYQCDKGADAYCPKLLDESKDSMGRVHQCMLVELGQPTPELEFRNVAVYRNMEFIGLSSATVPATISLEGLKNVLGDAEAKDRDVYLYVETRNLPAHGTKAMWLPTKDMQKALLLAQKPYAVPVEPGKELPRPGGQVPDKKKPPAPRGPGKQVAGPPVRPQPSPGQLNETKQRQELAARLALSNEKFSNGLPLNNVLAMGGEALMDAVWPTYRVRAYYDSGKTFKSGGQEKRVLIPMVPFGFRMQHDGALYGFSTALKALPGFTVEELGNNWYKLRVAKEGTAKVATSLTAEEAPRSDTTCETCTPCPQCPPPVDKGGICNCRVVRPLPGDSGGLGAGLLLGVLVALRRRFRAGRPQRST